MPTLVCAQDDSGMAARVQTGATHSMRCLRWTCTIGKGCPWWAYQ